MTPPPLAHGAGEQPVAVLDGGWADTRDAEAATHAWAQLHDVELRLACTHFVNGRVVVTLEPGPAPGSSADTKNADQPDDATHDLLRARHLARDSGRVFVFPGQQDLAAATTVAELLATTAVDDITVVGGARPPAATPLDTQAFVRPELRDGQVLLRVRPAAGGRLVPFEQPDPSQCCSDHR